MNPSNDPTTATFLSVRDRIALLAVLQAERDYIAGLLRDPSLNPYYVSELAKLVEPLTLKINHILSTIYPLLPPKQ